MKYIILVGDGMADYPIPELGRQTPLEVAKTPNMDSVAQAGKCGLVRTIPPGMKAASDVANLSILGYDPTTFYTGRGPLEAANMGVELESKEVAFRCNLITASEDILVDYSAGHISTEETKVLISSLNEKLASERIRFYPGVSYRNLLVIRGAGGIKDLSAECIPPHDITGEKISKNLPRGKGAEFLVNLMNSSRPILSNHEINHVRVDLGENPANMIWLWGQGERPNLISFRERFGITGSVISAVDLVKGIGRSIGLDVINVPGATGYYDTDYTGKAKYALDSLDQHDFVFVHVEAPDEAGHNGDIRQKIAAIENFDRLVVGAILENFKGRKDYRILVISDHLTPISLRTHTADPTPFAICGVGIDPDDKARFCEAEAKESSLRIQHGHKLIEYLIKGSDPVHR